ncbi:MAG: hypothetical protein RLZZ144_4 [Pseudomonadota bacterium]|jgi:hypothetical protein
MKAVKDRSWLVALGLMLAIALTRFNHFGSSFAVPDASLAVFILGGLYLARSPLAMPVFLVLLAESAAVDYYAISVGGISDWCVTPAYGLLAVVYGMLWAVGRLYATRHSLTTSGFFNLLAVATVASSAAFILSNVAFYLFSGRYAAMSAIEYTSRVKEYFSSYVLVALFYVALIAGVQLLIAALRRPTQQKTHAQ